MAFTSLSETLYVSSAERFAFNAKVIPSIFRAQILPQGAHSAP
jgi:hypothetical protein